MTRAGSITYVCSERGCATEITFRRDDHVPTLPWTCPACEAHLDELMRDEWARQEQRRRMRTIFDADGALSPHDTKELN